MGKVRNKKILLLVIGIIALLAVECAFAFFHTSDSIDNHFQTAEAKVYMKHLLPAIHGFPVRKNRRKSDLEMTERWLPYCV